MPQRLQRKRTAGWTAPKGAVYVGRPTKWGNPFKVGETIRNDSSLWPYVVELVPGGATTSLTALALLLPADAVAAYESWLYEQPHLMLSIREELGGRDLLCWCTPSAPCHADTLLALASGAEVTV